MPGVHKAVFPAAGIDTRFLPATKASPKEMLPVIDKPLIQLAAHTRARARQAPCPANPLAARGARCAIDSRRFA